MTSTAPSRSSMVTAAHGLPFLLILRWSDVTRPAITTVDPSGRPSSASRFAMPVSAARVSTCSRPESGWSDT